MTRHQGHGTSFEDMIKGSGFFGGSANSRRPMTSAFDIEARFDKTLNLPTSVKVAKGNSITLSDARRFWSISQPFRMLVGSYRQRSSTKVFYTVHEFIVHGTMIHTLRGSIRQEDVAAIHDGIAMRVFGPGCHQNARAWVRAEVNAMSSRRGLVALNPKIDSKGQRRLQCSVLLSNLRDMTSYSPAYLFGGEPGQITRSTRPNTGYTHCPSRS